MEFRSGTRHNELRKRFLGIDVGTETIKIVELTGAPDALGWSARSCVDHGQRPLETLQELLANLGWEHLAGAAVCGRFSRQVHLARIPDKVALSRGLGFLHGDDPLTLVTIGSRGFSVLERRPTGTEVYRTNGRCSQGTGNFLRQLVERFGLDVAAASDLVEGVEQPAALSGRCPVILKSDMTHLANAGESRPAILAGLFDAVCENVQTLLRPGSSPPAVILSGGVSRSRRVHRHFQGYLRQHGMELLSAAPSDDDQFIPALGCAIAAAASPEPLPPLSELVGAAQPPRLEWLPALSSGAGLVTRMPGGLAESDRAPASDPVILGLDVGSTGSKIVAVAASSGRAAWESYTETRGDPVGAAQVLVQRFHEHHPEPLPVLGIGVTGSGRQIAGSLLKTCFGRDRVYVVNEIVAHATGAVSFDPEVDTIFEIGGQDSKYIRLEGGRVVDAAMNEACSAGTGSFIAELGQRLVPGASVTDIGRRAFESSRGVSLGQHCSVFMAEVVDEALSLGVEEDAVLAGLHDSVIQNYLNRVKGTRGVGNVIFCQGMPFSSPALAAAAARQTGSRVVVPPNPGTVGALGIALLAHGHLEWAAGEALDLERFLEAVLERRDSFVCHATTGCGGTGNRCRIDRIVTRVEDVRRTFMWGGACSRYDKGAASIKLPDGAPAPFREREELARSLVEGTRGNGTGPRVGLTGEFVLKGSLPFFVTFLRALETTPVVIESGDREDLKSGIDRSQTSWCAPMQLFHGVIGRLARREVDHLLLPMLRSLPARAGAAHSGTCPICQASPDLLRSDLGLDGSVSVLAPVIDLGADGWRGAGFRETCVELARRLGVGGRRAESAFLAAADAQEEFERRCRDIGRNALAYAASHGIPAVVVLGRPYTIYNTILNSNVPAILCEQGALAIPLECFPIDPEVPVFEDMYWEYGQQMLRAAHDVRRTPGVYSMLCSNYSCGPDSFTMHFLADVMEGKPFTVIETDGHSGDAGTRTRIESYLHCVREHRAAEGACCPAGDAAHDHSRHHGPAGGLAHMRENGETLLVPWLSSSAAVIAASLRGEGVRAEALPYPGPEEFARGRKHTSGKECLPLALTLGSVLARIDQETDPERRFRVLMPTTRGPCRFGCYSTVFRMVLERVGLDDRAAVWSPADRHYFEEAGPATAAITIAGVTALDVVEATARLWPVNSGDRSRANAIRDAFETGLLAWIEQEVAGRMPMKRAFPEILGGGLFGCRDLLRQAADEFAALGPVEPRPTVLVTGEIYVRLDPFANGFVVEELERRGLGVRLSPLGEWFEYSADAALRKGARRGWRARLSRQLQLTIQERCHRIVASRVDIGPRARVSEILDSAEPWVSLDLYGEATLSVGAPLVEWHEGQIDGTVNVGPLECMPSRIAGSQLQHIAEREGLPVLNLSFSGEPIDPELLDGFAYEVRKAFERRRPGEAPILERENPRRTGRRAAEVLPGLGSTRNLGIRRRPSSG